MNLILPLYEKQIPQGVPANGISWEEIMENTRLAYFNLWKKGKKRYENVEGPNQKWSNYEYDAFLYLGPRGADLSSLKTGAMDDDNIDMDTSRASAKLGVKGMKRMKLDVDVPVQKELRCMRN